MGRSCVFLAIVLVGCLSAVSMVIGELETVTAGIEFGTSTSCISVYMNGRVEIIPNDQGNRTTPSWVAFTDSERPLIGEAAKNQAAANPERTIFDVKRLIGRKFEDKEVQSHMRDVPYKVVNQDGKPHIQVEATVFSPEEISAIFFTKQKETAEAFLGKKITKAVVPVPPYFDDAQRQATRDACFMAGYKTVKIINEPTSVGFAYGLHKVVAEKNAVVFDLGDATFDFSVLAIESGVIEILATTHNRLGGEDFNKRRIVGLLKKSMEDAGLENHQIDDIILVGASKNANFPKVQQLLKDYFDGKEPKTSVNPDEAIAFGAAVLGDVLTEQWRNLMC